MVYFHPLFQGSIITIFITGASSGIGAGLAEHYAQEGNHLILLARRIDRLELFRERFEKSGAKVTLYEADVTNFDLMQKIGTEISKLELDLIILNAGISTGHDTHNPSFKVAKAVFDTNFITLHALLEPIIPALQKQGHGHIVFISSLASLFTMPTSIIYGSSKRAVNAYAEGLRYMLSPYNIDVTTIKPGFIQSDLTAKNNFDMPFLLPLSKGVSIIAKAIRKKRKIYAFPMRFVLIIKVLNFLPFSLREKIVTYKNFKKE